MKIQTILATKGAVIRTIRAEQTLKEVIQLLAEYRIGAMVVVDAAGSLIGIISERDIIRVAASDEAMPTRRVGDVMTRQVVTGTPNDDVRSVLSTMTERRFRHLPIIDRGKLAGIISIGDVVKAQLDEYEGTIESLQNTF